MLTTSLFSGTSGLSGAFSSAWGSDNTSSQQLRQSTSRDLREAAFTQPSASSQDPPTANMFCPPSITYDPEQAEQQDGDGYQRWVDAYAQGQFDYGGAGNVPQVSYQQPQQPPHTHPVMSAPVNDMSRGASHAQMQNQYGMVSGQFIPVGSNPQGNPYAQQFVQGRSGDRQAALVHASMAQRYQPLDQPMNPLSVEYATSQQQQGAGSSQPVPPASIMHHGYQPQQVQQQQQYAPPHPEQYVQEQQPSQVQAGPSHGVPYYFQPPSTEYVGDPGQQPHQAFTFTQFAAGSEHLSAPNSTYPSPDPTTFASSMSPSSRAGTDDGQSHHSLPSGASPQPSKAQPMQQQAAASSSRLSPHQAASSAAKRGRATASSAKAKSNPAKRRRRSDLPADNSDTGSDEEDFVASNSVVPPLKGPENVPPRPYVVFHACCRSHVNLPFSSIRFLPSCLFTPYIHTARHLLCGRRRNTFFSFNDEPTYLFFFHPSPLTNCWCKFDSGHFKLPVLSGRSAPCLILVWRPHSRYVCVI